MNLINTHGKKPDDLGLGKSPTRLNSMSNLMIGKKISFNMEEPMSAGFGKSIPLGQNNLLRKLTMGAKQQSSEILMSDLESGDKELSSISEQSKLTPIIHEDEEE